MTSAAATLAGVRFMHPATDGLTIPDPIPDASIFQPAPWVAPSSEQLPFLRRRLHEHYTTIAAEGAQQGRTGQVARAAAVESEDREVRRYARDEAGRLKNASLTWVDHEAIEMAVTYSSTPSTEPASPDRMPSMTGFMLFESCIGGALYDAARAQDLPGSGWTPAPWLYDVSGYVEAPIVAISWSRLPPPHEDRVQLSFYTPNRPPHWDGLPPDTFVAQWAATKTRYSAGYFADHVRTVSARMSPMPVLATFTATLQFGELLPEPDANHCAGWVQTVYGLWQLLDHKVKKPLTHTDVIAAPRSVTRGDARAGIIATIDVNIVRVHPRFRTKDLPPDDGEDNADHDTSDNSRRSPHYRHRYWRGPYRANMCMNTWGHSEGNCEHKEVPVGRHLRGPVGAPFRERVTELRGSPARNSGTGQPKP
ncbi:hypothetical protein [Amycolatopsis albispora]|nr:hypothetical protein [Amycolatopsis albispora]